MTNLQAALGLGQLERLDEVLERKKEIGALYNTLLKDVLVVQKPLPFTYYADNLYWVYGLVLAPECNLDASQLMKLLASNGVGSRPVFFPMHLQPVLLKMGLLASLNIPV